MFDISNIMKVNTPTSTVLYSIEEAIKAYRKLSFKNIATVIPDITVDQALILIIINNNELTQSEIADLIFKDYASMTRILSLMIKKKYILKTVDENDRRKSKLKLSEKGSRAIEKLTPIIDKNRRTALNDISIEEQNNLYRTLKKITQNCKII